MRNYQKKPDKPDKKYQELVIAYLRGKALANGYSEFCSHLCLSSTGSTQIEGFTRWVEVCNICGAVIYTLEGISPERAMKHGKCKHLLGVTIEMLEAYAALVQMRGEAAASDVFFGKGDQQK